MTGRRAASFLNCLAGAATGLGNKRAYTYIRLMANAATFRAGSAQGLVGGVDEDIRFNCAATHQRLRPARLHCGLDHRKGGRPSGSCFGCERFRSNRNPSAHGRRSWGMGACNANDQGMPVWVKGSSAHSEYLGKRAQSSKRKTDCVVRVLQSRGHCIPFRPTIPPLQVAPSSACSVASLSQSPGH